MAVVVGGLGQPEESPLVTGGIGQAGTPPAGAVCATLAGVGSLSGTLTADGAPAPVRPPGGRPMLSVGEPVIKRRPRRIRAHLVGTSTVTAELTAIDHVAEFNAEVERLLLLDLV